MVPICGRNIANITQIVSTTAFTTSTCFQLRKRNNKVRESIPETDQNMELFLHCPSKELCTSNKDTTL